MARCRWAALFLLCRGEEVQARKLTEDFGCDEYRERNVFAAAPVTAAVAAKVADLPASHAVVFRLS